MIGAAMFWRLVTIFWRPEGESHYIRDGRFVCGRWRIRGKRGRIGTNLWRYATCPDCRSDPGMEAEDKAQRTEIMSKTRSVDVRKLPRHCCPKNCCCRRLEVCVTSSLRL